MLELTIAIIVKLTIVCILCIIWFLCDAFVVYIYNEYKNKYYKQGIDSDNSTDPTNSG